MGPVKQSEMLGVNHGEYNYPIKRIKTDHLESALSVFREISEQEELNRHLNDVLYNLNRNTYESTHMILDKYPKVLPPLLNIAEKNMDLQARIVNGICQPLLFEKFEKQLEGTREQQLLLNYYKFHNPEEFQKVVSIQKNLHDNVHENRPLNNTDLVDEDNPDKILPFYDLFNASESSFPTSTEDTLRALIYLISTDQNSDVPDSLWETVVNQLSLTLTSLSNNGADDSSIFPLDIWGDS